MSISRENGQLDALDRKILHHLSQNGRITWRDLADSIGLSLTPTLRRVRILEERGYITGYFAALDERRLKGGLIVFISVTLERHARHALDAFEEKVSLWPEIMSGFLMSGGADFLLRAVVPDMDRYRELLEKLTAISGVANVQSSFALKAFVNRPSLLLSES